MDNNVVSIGQQVKKPGGKSICPHGRQVNRCIKCGGSLICEHNRLKYICRPCGGSAWCIHEKLKSHCRICGGAALCEHDENKYTCEICIKLLLCCHNIKKSKCIECQQKFGWCSHGKISNTGYRCRPKTPRGYPRCEHGKQKKQCKACSPLSFCIHGRCKSRCVECGGTGICVHKKRKELCLLCGGKSLCIHNRSKYTCTACTGKRSRVYNILCCHCHHATVRKREDVCAVCDPVASSRSRVREARMAYKLEKWASSDLIPSYTTWNRRNPLADPAQCGRYMPDFVFEGPVSVVLDEFDENQHRDRTFQCELVRMAEVSLGYGGQPVHWIRYNPDSFRVNGVLVEPSLHMREKMHLSQLQSAFEITSYDYLINITYICYSVNSGGRSLPNEGDWSFGNSDLLRIYRFKTIEDYVSWAEMRLGKIESSAGARKKKKAALPPPKPQ